VDYNPRRFSHTAPPEVDEGSRHAIATKKQVREKLRQMITRLDEVDDSVRADLARALPHPKMIQIDVTDLEVSFWTELAEGRMGELEEGRAEAVDIRMRAKSDDLVAMIDGELGLMSSFLSGRVRVDASLSDLLALRKLA
jgi:predicted lipid carrier protein YhbT